MNIKKYLIKKEILFLIYKNQVINRLFKNIKSNQKGFGMIELLVTVVILGIGMYSILNLMGSLVYANRVNSIEFVALNLAREGVEVVKNIRDSNWLIGKQWDDGLYFGNDTTATVEFEPLTSTWKLNFVAEDIYDEHSNLNFDKTTGLYLHNGNYEKTEFYRLLSLNTVCYDEILFKKIIKQNNEQCFGNEEKIGINVVSTVMWRKNLNSSQSVVTDKTNTTKQEIKKEVSTFLYNWR